MQGGSPSNKVGTVKRGTLLRRLVVSGFSVHPVRFQSSLGCSLHCTPFDGANGYSGERFNIINV